MEKGELESFVISEQEVGQRLDTILADRYRDVKSRTYFQTLIDKKTVLLNGEPTKKRIRPKIGDTVEIQFIVTPEMHLTPEPIPLDVLYEDDAIIAINKPPGMVVHPAPGNWSGTLVNALLHHCKDLSEVRQFTIHDPLPRPGIVHRLDKDTSGVLIAAKHSKAHEELVRMFANREVTKEYLAICLGNPGNATISGSIGRHPVRRKEMSILEEGGKEAHTECHTLAFNGKLSLVQLLPRTGRTHQLRVHMKHHRTPILGDATYGNSGANRLYAAERQLLHARKLELKHPITGKPLVFTAAIPDDMQKWGLKCEF